MKILVSGSTGLIGSALVSFLETRGHEVTCLVRSRTARDGQIYWNPESGELEPIHLEGSDATVHLAGENIASGRWTDKRMARIRSSRVNGTKLLCGTLAKLSKPPKVLLCASAIGFYGDRGEELLTEESSGGTGFLAEVCRDWEAAVRPATERGIRTVNLRFGVVLSTAGGALTKMLTPFRMGVGGRIGTGRQFMSWLSLDDAIGAVYHALVTHTLSGPINTVAPNPVTNLEFTKSLGRILRRPTIAPMPAFAARLAFGQMADELLLGSTRVEPALLKSINYDFHHPVLDAALRYLTGKAG